ncbi:hypothetical protein SAMN05216466_109225 [Paraburkholderia phenazinium]|uniref:Uncharacterized protein n=1 Tax=Paraburkholderia phenazinium TaxID=60549 RepID=A0A1G8C0I5_9BURK|nr:hypothetical protein SAMN05216466_109225 [Paraburkholderia phenazinium]
MATGLGCENNSYESPLFLLDYFVNKIVQQNSAQVLCGA